MNELSVEVFSLGISGLAITLGWSATLTLVLVPVSPSLRRKRDEGCFSCTTASPLVGRALDWTKLKCLSRLCPFVSASLTGTVWNKDSGARCYSGATRSAGCLLASYLFHHLLLHFLRCGLCDVGSDHPSVTLGIDNGSTAVAPKHIHHGSLGRGPSFTALETVLSAFYVSRYKLVGEAPIVFALREPCDISGPNINVVPRSVSSAWMALPSGPFNRVAPGFRVPCES